MNKARAFFAAVELLNGSVLVAGGYDGRINGPPNFADAEIYNVDTGGVDADRAHEHGTCRARCSPTGEWPGHDHWRIR